MSFPHHPARPFGASPADRRPEAAGDTQLRELARDVARSRRRFAAVNGTWFALALLLDCTAGGLLAHPVLGRVSLGMVVGVVQGALLLTTALWYDRLSARRFDPRGDELRARAEASAHRADARGSRRGAAWTVTR